MRERPILKPCPFCGGGETQFDQMKYWTGQRSIIVNSTLTHWCQSDESRKPMISITRSNDDDCIAVWNKRIGGDHA